MVLISICLRFYWIDSWIYTTGNPEAGSGLSTLIFYDSNNEEIKRCIRYSYYPFIEEDSIMGLKSKIQTFKYTVIKHLHKQEIFLPKDTCIDRCLIRIHLIRAAARQIQQKWLSKDSDRPKHPPRLIRIFSDCMSKIETDQTGRIPRLKCVFAWRTGNVMVLSDR